MKPSHIENPQSLLENVQARFDHWRRTRRKREAIPEELWSAAAALTETYSLCRVARQMRLNPDSLKRKINQQEPSPRKDIVNASSFIEIPLIPTGHTASCQVDILRPDGSRMQIRLPREGTELSALVRAFLG